MPRKKMSKAEKFILFDNILQSTGIRAKSIGRIGKEKIFENFLKFAQKKLKKKWKPQQIESELSRMAITIALRKTAKVLGIKVAGFEYEEILKKATHIIEKGTGASFREKERMRKNFASTIKRILAPIEREYFASEGEALFWRHLDELYVIVRKTLKEMKK